jgi:uncharacterized protein YkwD
VRLHQKTARRFVTLIAILGIAAALPSCARVRSAAPKPPPVVTIPASDAAAEKQVVASVNSLRAARGLRPLSVHPSLTNKARYWALWMSAGNCGRGIAICHSVLSAGIRVPWSLLAENVGAASPRTNIAGVTNGFKNSPSHLANILNRQATYLGVGVAYAGNMVYVVEEFMAP